MNKIDRKLLNLAQAHFPICAKPYAHFAEKLGITEDEVVKRLKILKRKGIIRRIGGVFDSRKLGYTNCLIAAKVPDDRVPKVAEYINRFPGVTHNYERTQEYNLWFTLAAGSKDKFNEILRSIRKVTGINDIKLFPAIRVFQSKVNFVM